MNKDKYLKCIGFFRQPGWKSTLLFFMSKVVPIIIANIYIIVCVLVLMVNPVLLVRIIGVPLCAFVLVTILRKVINKKRPYEVYDFHPIRYDNKIKHGQSFPSRHCVSATVIAIACLAFVPWLGCVLLVLAVIVAISRVIAGLHFVIDVACGMLLGAIIGIIGFWPYIF